MILAIKMDTNPSYGLTTGDSTEQQLSVHTQRIQKLQLSNMTMIMYVMTASYITTWQSILYW